MEAITVCPVCGSADIEDAGVVKRFYLMNLDQVVRMPYAVCRDCHLIFQANYPGDEFINDYYTKSPALRRREITDIEALVYHRQADFIQRGGTLFGQTVLEVGADTGQFLAFLQHGYNCRTYFDELSLDARAIILERGGIQDIREHPETQVGLVVLRHVLEHVHDLAGFLAWLRSLLREKGALFIEVPDWSFLDRETDHYIFEHIQQFNSHCLNLLLRKHGFVVEHQAMDILPEARSTPNRVLRVLARRVDLAALGDRGIVQAVQRHDRLKESVIGALNRFLAKLPDQARIAVTPASHYTFQFLLNSNLPNHRIVGLFDADKRKAGKVFQGLTIHPSSSVMEHEPDVVLVLTVGAYKDEMVRFFSGLDPRLQVYSQTDVEKRYGADPEAEA